MRAWLWVVVTPLVIFFAIHSKRSAESARATLGAGVGALISDRFSGYSWWPLNHRARFWNNRSRTSRDSWPKVRGSDATSGG